MPADFIERISKGPGLCAGGYYLELEGRCLGSYKSHIPRGVLDYPEGMLEIDKICPERGRNHPGNGPPEAATANRRCFAAGCASKQTRRFRGGALFVASDLMSFFMCSILNPAPAAQIAKSRLRGPHAYRCNTNLEGEKILPA